MEDIKTAVILAGGRGTRFSEYTKTIPKPMIEAKGKPLLIHIINIYKLQGISNFYILTGYKSEVIENYFRSIFNETSEKNRLTITVNVTYSNNINSQNEFVTSFSRFKDYESNQNFIEIEETLIEEITEEITEDIFNKAFVNW